MTGVLWYRGWRTLLILSLLSWHGQAAEIEAGMLERSLASDATLVAAHRGCWRLAPENSLAAMDACIAMGVHMLEIDVRRSADGQLVVLHDRTLDRTTASSGAVNELPAERVLGLRLREGSGGSDAPLTVEVLPSLAQVLNHLKGRTLINLDVKDPVLPEVIAAVTALDMNDQVLLKAVVDSPQSSSVPSAETLQGITFMPIIRPQNGEPAEQIARFAGTGVKAFEVIFEDEPQLRAACAAAQKMGARCWVNTMWDYLSPGHADDQAHLAPDAHWGHLQRLGVTMIQTDRPGALLDYLNGTAGNRE